MPDREPGMRAMWFSLLPWGVFKRMVKGVLRPWRLVGMELRNKLHGWPRAVRLRRFEGREVRRLSAVTPTPPRARVAVIIPTFKRPELLLGAVRSALAQTVKDIVVVVVDDGGGLPELPADPRLFLCSLSANTRVGGVARNVGIKLTRSEYVAFLDDDNEWEPHHLEVALGAFAEEGPGRAPDFVYTAMQRRFPDGRTHDVLSVEFDRRLLASRNFVDTNAMVIRRFPGLHWSRLRRRQKMGPACDWELTYRLSRKMVVQHVSVPTVRYRLNPDSYFNDWAGSGVL